MGAYYVATNITDREVINTWDYNTGSKLMEHSYIGNTYLDVVLYEIHEGSWKNKEITWLCDYDESSQYEGIWENGTRIKSSSENTDWLDYSNAIIINNDTKEYIDLVEYKLNWFGERKWIIHPFSLLTSSTTESMGGGDYHYENDNRGRWAGNRFVVTFNKLDIPANYTNITSEVYFYEDEEIISLSKDEMKYKALQIDCKPDFSTNERVIRKLDNSASKSEVMNALKENNNSKIKFRKANGEVVERTATLDKDYISSNPVNPDNEKYLWFFDTTDNRLKKMVFANFISLEIA